MQRMLFRTDLDTPEHKGSGEESRRAPPPAHRTSGPGRRQPEPPILAPGPRVDTRPLATPATGGALSRCDSPQLPFQWTLNPYRGCEIACGYCYARYTHQYLGLDDPRDFERRIFVKDDCARLLGHDLDRRVADGESIAIGTATDPYQPLERHRRITRACLKVMVRRSAARPFRVSITTKSDLVVRDLDLLRVLADRGMLHVNVTITTMDRVLARDLEPRAVSPERRIRAVETLAAEGIPVGVFLMPVLPGLTDGPQGDPTGFEHVIARAGAAGAAWIAHQVVFLREPTRSWWFGFLKRRFPALVDPYHRWFAGGAYADESLRTDIAERVDLARLRAGVAGEPADTRPADPQMRLAFVDDAVDAGGEADAAACA
ncbi:MAG: SPL family radical SAM protein [Planctomycetota bacterium]